MFSALLYLQFQTLKNRLLERLRRLRRPRYLFGALAGGFYLWVAFGRSLFSARAGFGAGHHPPVALLPGIPDSVWEFVAALALAILAVLAWLVPHERAALVFTESEIAFLFPAPIRRQTLIHYKLVRSQVAVLFTVFFLTLFTRWSGGGLAASSMRAAGWWLLLSTINLHLIGASFARTLLLERGITPWRRRGWILVGLLAVVGGAVWWTRGQVPPLGPGDIESIGALARYVQTVADTAPAQWLLLPFRVVVRPFLASADAVAFGAAVWPAGLLLALHYLWVVRSDVAFEEASIAASQRYAVRAAAIRSGNWQNTRPARKRRAPFRLAPTGSPAVAILWKNLLGAGQFFNARLAIAVIAWSAIMGTTFGSGGGGKLTWPLLAGLMCAVLLGVTLLTGPQFVRQDFRRDLAVADLLKIYPMRGWQVALGELLAPAVILTVIQWVLIVLAATLLSGSTLLSIQGRVPIAYGLALAVICPAFNLVSLLIPNAAALLLPAWFASSNTPGASGNSRGIEVMGQRLLFLLAQMVALTLALLPAGLAFFLVYLLAAQPYLPDLAALPLSACVAALVFAGEAVGGIALLGNWFENYDLSVERLS